MDGSRKGGANLVGWAEVLGWVLAGETVDMYLTLFNLAYNLVYVNIRIGLVSFILYLRG